MIYINMNNLGKLADIIDFNENQLVNDKEYQGAYLRTRDGSRQYLNNGVNEKLFGTFQTFRGMTEDEEKRLGADNEIFETGLNIPLSDKYLEIVGGIVPVVEKRKNNKSLVQQSVATYREKINEYNVNFSPAQPFQPIADANAPVESLEQVLQKLEPTLKRIDSKQVPTRFIKN